jgi:WhiB family redox-sensing transcriptional regulator
MPTATSRAGDDFRRPTTAHPWSHPQVRGLPSRDWVAAAACAGSDTSLFFAETGDTYPAEVVAICTGCPVRNCCLEWAIDAHESAGLWGGLADP